MLELYEKQHTQRFNVVLCVYRIRLLIVINNFPRPSIQNINVSREARDAQIVRQKKKSKIKKQLNEAK